VLLKLDLGFQQVHFCGWFVKLKLIISSNFRYDQIHICRKSYFGHTFLCSISQTYMFNNPQVKLKRKTKRDQIRNNNCYILGQTFCSINWPVQCRNLGTKILIVFVLWTYLSMVKFKPIKIILIQGRLS
jgi:hypothetical protein